MKRALFIGIAVLAGAATTALLWPPWYDMGPVIPLTERLTRAAIAILPGMVVIAVGLELLVGLPLVSWLVTWSDNLATKGRPKTPGAAWRALRAQEASWRWPLGLSPKARAERRARLSAGSTAAHGAQPLERRAYADVRQEYHEHGDEDPLEYGPKTPRRET